MMTPGLPTGLRAKRSLKIEARLEDNRPYVIPYLRLRGKWLEKMGFPPERHVEVSLIEPGRLEIRLQPVDAQANGVGGP